MKKVQVCGAFAMAVLEAFVLVEILWYTLSGGEQTLHGAVHEYLEGLKERAERRASIERTARHLRDLPET